MKRNETKGKRFEHRASRSGRLICRGDSLRVGVLGFALGRVRHSEKSFSICRLPAGLASGCQVSVAVPPATRQGSESICIKHWPSDQEMSVWSPSTPPLGPARLLYVGHQKGSETSVCPHVLIWSPFTLSLGVSRCCQRLLLSLEDCGTNYTGCESPCS